MKENKTNKTNKQLKLNYLAISVLLLYGDDDSNFLLYCGKEEIHCEIKS